MASDHFILSKHHSCRFLICAPVSQGLRAATRPNKLLRLKLRFTVDKEALADKLAEQRKVLADKEGSVLDNITNFLSSLFDKTRGLPDFITFTMPNPLLNV